MIDAETRPFFLILISVLAFLYGFVLYSTPELRQLNRLILFTLLMAVHGVLHWYVAYLTTRPTHLALYLTVQILIVIALTFVARQEAIILGLYLALAGETVGILGTWRRSLIAIAGYLGLIVLSFAFFWGWTAAPQWIGTVLIMLLFVFVYVVLYIRQLQAREKAQRLLAELQTAHSQLTEYSQRVEDLTRDAERQRMARELHDTLAQGLAGLVLQLEAMEAHWEKGAPGRARQIAGEAGERARTTLAEARRAIDDLRRSETMPLEAITHEVERFRTATGIRCRVTLPQSLSLSKSCGNHAVRFVAEGLANAMRHARATEVQVAAEEENEQIHLRVKDNGIGFDEDGAAASGGHYGLLGLRERARLIGATLTVESAPGQGTVLTMTIPTEACSP